MYRLGFNAHFNVNFVNFTFLMDCTLHLNHAVRILCIFSISLLLSLLAHLLFIPGLITVIHYTMVFQKSN